MENQAAKCEIHKGGVIRGVGFFAGYVYFEALDALFREDQLTPCRRCGNVIKAGLADEGHSRPAQLYCQRCETFAPRWARGRGVKLWIDTERRIASARQLLPRGRLPESGASKSPGGTRPGSIRGMGDTGLFGAA